MKCQLVNTVDSSNVTTPIIGLVTEDVCWNGKVIIPANSEVHGTASVDPVRERIASEGEYTFILSDNYLQTASLNKTPVKPLFKRLAAPEADPLCIHYLEHLAHIRTPKRQ